MNSPSAVLARFFLGFFGAAFFSVFAEAFFGLYAMLFPQFCFVGISGTILRFTLHSQIAL